MPRSKTTNKQECNGVTPDECSTLPTVISGKFPALPEHLADKIDAIEECVRAGRRLSHWLSVLVARAREDYATPAEWLDDMERRFGWQRAHIHHMRAVGDLFWECRNQECCVTTLLECNIDKLVCISRLPADKVAPFLEAGDPRGQTRDQVRARVNKWLGQDEPAKTPPKQLSGKNLQGDFFALLEGMSDWDAWAASLDNTKAATATFASLRIIRAASTQYDDEDRAEAARLLRAEADRIEKGL